MKISIIIPNYNHAKFLKKRIDSILNQKFTDFEVIILDDCSTDDSRDIINSYKDERISLKLFNDKNSGSPFKQWKKGIEAAKYDYIWIAESDDWVDKNFLSEANKAINSNPNISIFFSDSVLVDENEKPYHNSLQSYTKELDSKLWNSSHFSEGLKYFNRFFIHKCIILNASSAVFKKNYALKHIDEVLDFKTQGDWLFWCLMLKEGNIFYAAEKLNYFRHHSLTTRNYNSKEKRETRILEKIKFYEKILNNYVVDNQIISEKKQNIIKEWIFNHNFNEQFKKSFYLISEYRLINIKPTELLFLSLKTKFRNLYNIYIKTKKHD